MIEMRHWLNACYDHQQTFSLKSGRRIKNIWQLYVIIYHWNSSSDNVSVMKKIHKSHWGVWRWWLRHYWLFFAWVEIIFISCWAKTALKERHLSARIEMSQTHICANCFSSPSPSNTHMNPHIIFDSYKTLIFFTQRGGDNNSCQ